MAVVRGFSLVRFGFSLVRFGFSLVRFGFSLVRLGFSLVPFVPAVLLICVATAQMTLARHALLSPWKGGGFGMFASIDGLPFRQVRVFVEAPNRSEEIALPESLEVAGAKAATWPHASALERLGRAVIAREHSRGRAADSVRVEVWRAGISPSLESTWLKLSEVTIAADPARHVDRRAAR
jgi:hypothetical protein